MEKRDCLIIGQGIAGSILARYLERSGKSFHIVQSQQLPGASRVAAGVWNPIVVKRFTKTWLADETIPEAKEFFNREEQAFGAPFLFETRLRKILSNEEEMAQMEKRWTEMQPFVSDWDGSPIAEGLDSPHGYLEVKNAGYANVPGYLDACKAHWNSSASYIETDFKHADLVKGEEGWSWNNTSYAQVIFCEGISGRNNPWLKHLPLTNTKGQVLEVKIDELRTSTILNKQLFILPQQDGNFRVGSTYEWNTEDLSPDEEGKNYLLEKLGKIIPGKKVEILRQEAGGRPTTKDRRPLMGELNEQGLFVFNGLGSRGVLLAPFLAACMVACLNGDPEAIPEEARLQRIKAN